MGFLGKFKNPTYKPYSMDTCPRCHGTGTTGKCEHGKSAPHTVREQQTDRRGRVVRASATRCDGKGRRCDKCLGNGRVRIR